MLRVPFWATGANSVRRNGAAVSVTPPSSYLRLELADGDEVEVHYPMALRFEQLDDPRPTFKGVGAIMYGPLMLAAVGADSDRLLLDDDGRTLERVVRRNSSVGLSFSASRAACGGAALPDLWLIPFNNLTNAHADARYSVYFHTARRAFSRTTATGVAAITLAGADDLDLSGGASLVTNGAAAHNHAAHGHATHRALEDPGHRHAFNDYDEATGSHYGRGVGAAGAPLNIRAGNPGQTTFAAMAAPFAGGARRLRSLAVDLQYVIGYGNHGGIGASVALVLEPDVQCPAANTSELWRSPALLEPSYDANHTNYSTLAVRLDGLDLSVAPATATPRLALRFDNGDHNMQLLLPVDIELGWH